VLGHSRSSATLFTGIPAIIWLVSLMDIEKSGGRARQGAGDHGGSCSRSFRSTMVILDALLFTEGAAERDGRPAAPCVKTSSRCAWRCTKNYHNTYGAIPTGHDPRSEGTRPPLSGGCPLAPLPRTSRRSTISSARRAMGQRQQQALAGADAQVFACSVVPQAGLDSSPYQVACRPGTRSNSEGMRMSSITTHLNIPDGVESKAPVLLVTRPGPRYQRGPVAGSELPSGGSTLLAEGSVRSEDLDLARHRSDCHDQRGMGTRASPSDSSLLTPSSQIARSSRHAFLSDRGGRDGTGWDHGGQLDFALPLPPSMWSDATRD